MNQAMETTNPTNSKTFARVLREIVAEHKVNELLDYLYEYYYSWKQNSSGEQIDINKMRARYVDAINDLTHQPTREEPTGTILIEYDHTNAVVQDVTYHHEEDPTQYSMQLIPWDVVANCLLTYPGLQYKIHAAAYVLHEITFFGFTSDEQLEESQKTFNAEIDDSDHIMDIDEWYDNLMGGEETPVTPVPDISDS